jgi:hypothetical protein
MLTRLNGLYIIKCSKCGDLCAGEDAPSEARVTARALGWATEKPDARGHWTTADYCPVCFRDLASSSYLGEAT